jgi:hypothetical protein
MSNTDHITVGGFTLPVGPPRSWIENPAKPMDDPGALVGQRVQIFRQPAPNRFGRAHPPQELTGILTSARRISHSDWTLVLDDRSYIAFGPNGGHFTQWHIAGVKESDVQ